MTQLLSPITKEMPAATHPGTLVVLSRAGGLMGPLFGTCLCHPHAVCWDKTSDVSSIWAARTGVIYRICQQSKGQGPVEWGCTEKSWQHGGRRGNHEQEGSQESPLPICPSPMTCGISELCKDYLMLSSVSFDHLSWLWGGHPTSDTKPDSKPHWKLRKVLLTIKFMLQLTENKSLPSACSWTNKGLVWNWRSQEPVRDPI